MFLRLFHSLWQPWGVNASDLQRAHDAQASHHLGRLGIPFHCFFAAAWAFVCVGPITFVELGYIPLGVMFLIRLPFIWPSLRLLVRVPLFWGCMLFAIWSHVSILWSPDVHQGVRDAGAVRFMLMLFFIWPVMHARRAMIFGLVLGFAAAGFTQVLEVVGHRFDMPGLVWSHPPIPEGTSPRLSMWWHQPAVGGTMLAAGFAMHLPAAFGLMIDRGPRQMLWRIVGCLGCVVAFAGILATGTRGAMLAACAAVVIAALAKAWSMVARRHTAKLTHAPAGVALAKNRGRTLIVPVIAGLMALLLLGGTWLVVGNQVSERAKAAVAEVRSALSKKNYASDTGARIAMAKWAVEAFAQKPMTGSGAGSFRTIAQQAIASERLVGVRAHAQAHNTPLHIAATLGVPGLILFGWIVVAGLCGGSNLLKRLRSNEGLHNGSMNMGERSNPWNTFGGGAYDLAPVFALVGLLLAGMFDTVLVNTQEAALLWTLVALCVPFRAIAPVPGSTEKAKKMQTENKEGIKA